MLELLNQNEVNKIVYSLAIIFGAIILRFVLKVLVDKIGARIVSLTQTDIDDKILQSFRKHSKYIILFLALYSILEVNAEFFTPELLATLDAVFYILFFSVILSLVLFSVGLVVEWYLSILAKKTGSNIAIEFGPLAQRLLKALVLIVGISIAFEHFNIDIKGLVVSLGVGSLALAFAAQDTLANMIAGFVIMVDRPFRRGDRIKLESGEVGDVYDIGLRSIKIIDFENTIHIIPNKEIANTKIINYSYPDTKIRVKISVGVAYGSNIDQVKQILIDAYKKHPVILDEPAPAAYFVNMGESSLDFIVVGRVAEYTNQWRVSEELRVNIYNEFVKAGIEIPFPQRTLHISDESLKAISKST